MSDLVPKKVYSFKDVVGGISNLELEVNNISFSNIAPTHLMLPLEKARELLGNKIVDEYLEKPVLHLYLSGASY